MKRANIIKKAGEIKEAAKNHGVILNEVDNEYTLWVEEGGSYRFIGPDIDYKDALARAESFSDRYPDLFLLYSPKEMNHVVKLYKGKPNFDYFGTE
jgi:hypothetical protein